MKKLFVLLMPMLLFGCENLDDGNQVTFEYLTDRVWMNRYDHQVYFTKDSGRYDYMSFEIKEGKWYTPFELAEGTPKTNLIEDNYNNYAYSGWHLSEYFKLKGDSIYLQEDEDVKGEYVERKKIWVGQDTTIGIFEYNTIYIGHNIYGDSIKYWSKKQ